MCSIAYNTASLERRLHMAENSEDVKEGRTLSSNTSHSSKESIKSMDSSKKPYKQRGFFEDLLGLILKIGILIVIFWGLFIFVFGLNRVSDSAMDPSIKMQDLVMFYRFDKSYETLDPIVLKVDNKIQVRRVMATEGDVVDINDKGLVVNGNNYSAIDSKFVVGETKPVQNGITYPLTLKKGEYFVLGDNRESAIDSRTYGPVTDKQTMGTLMWDLRQRGL